MDNDTKQVLLKWMPVILLFLIIACTCLYFIFSPVKLYITQENNLGQKQELVYGAPATSLDGILYRVESWKKYPEYNIGLGIASAFSFLGAGWTMTLMYREAKEEAT